MSLLIDTPTLAKMKLSISVNGFYVPFKDIVRSIRRFCPPALFHYEDPVLDVSPSGSAFLFRYRGRNFGLCTRHQLGIGATAINPERFMITAEEADGRRVGLSPNRVSRVSFADPAHSNLADMFLAEFDDVRNGRNVRGLFLETELSRNFQTVQSVEIKLILSLGYPTAARNIDLQFDEAGDEITGADITLRWVKLYLELDGPALLDPENRRPLVKHRTYEQDDVDPDGMSGAPVFFVQLDASSNAHLGFGGMITHAAGGRYAAYDGAALKQIVDGYIDQKD